MRRSAGARSAAARGGRGGTAVLEKHAVSELHDLYEGFIVACHGGDGPAVTWITAIQCDDDLPQVMSIRNRVRRLSTHHTLSA